MASVYDDEYDPSIYWGRRLKECGQNQACRQRVVAEYDELMEQQRVAKERSASQWSSNAQYRHNDIWSEPMRFSSGYDEYFQNHGSTAVVCVSLLALGGLYMLTKKR
jgi:hypothetical protein